MINIKAVVVAYWEGGKKMVITVIHRIETSSSKQTRGTQTSAPNNIINYHSVIVIPWAGSRPFQLSSASPLCKVLQPQPCCQSQLESHCPLSQKIRAPLPSHQALHPLVSTAQSLKHCRKNGCVIKV